MTVHTRPPPFDLAAAPSPAPTEVASGRPIPADAGIGLRLPHHDAVRDTRPAIAWLEAHPENYMTQAQADELAALADRYPVSLHAVGLSLGSACGLDVDHLMRL